MGVGKICPGFRERMKKLTRRTAEVKHTRKLRQTMNARDEQKSKNSLKIYVPR